MFHLNTHFVLLNFIHLQTNLRKKKYTFEKVIFWNKSSCRNHFKHYSTIEFVDLWLNNCQSNFWLLTVFTIVQYYFIYCKFISMCWFIWDILQTPLQQTDMAYILWGRFMVFQRLEIDRYKRVGCRNMKKWNVLR